MTERTVSREISRSRKPVITLASKKIRCQKNQPVSCFVLHKSGRGHVLIGLNDDNLPVQVCYSSESNKPTVNNLFSSSDISYVDSSKFRDKILSSKKKLIYLNDGTLIQPIPSEFQCIVYDYSLEELFAEIVQLRNPKRSGFQKISYAEALKLCDGNLTRKEYESIWC